MKELEFETGIAKFDLSVEMYEDHEFHCRFEYNTDLFEKQTILRKLGHFRNLVSCALENPDQLLSQIPLMDTHEREQIIVEWNNTPAEYSRALRIHTAFELQAASTPKSTALRFQGTELSYQHINEDANRLAHYLIKKGLGPGMLVGVCVERSPEMVVALLAALKTGAAYVPLDPSYPEERLSFMIDDARLGCVVTRNGIQKRLPTSVPTVIALDSEVELIRNESLHNPSLDLSGIQRAYVIYTSGSSGRPKGVEGTHRGAINRFWWMWERYPFEAGEVCCQKTNLGFVDSIWEIFGPLLAGVPSVILPPETVLDPEELLQSLARHGGTRVVLGPSRLRALLDHGPDLGQRGPKLELWSGRGEVVSGGLARRVRTGG